MIRLSIAACVPRLRQEQPDTAKDKDTRNQHRLAYQHVVLQCAKGRWWLDWLQQCGSWSHTGNNAHGDCHEVQNASLQLQPSQQLPGLFGNALVHLTAYFDQINSCANVRTVPTAAEAVANHYFQEVQGCWPQRQGHAATEHN